MRQASFGGFLPIAAIFLLCALCLDPRRAFPLDDDWHYTLVVNNLLAEGRLRLLAATATQVAHVLWGALFCAVTGSSFAALRLSTLALSLLGLGCFHLLLKRCRVGAWPAFVATALLLANPLYLTLSYTFMTDVPFLAWTLASLYAYLRGVQEEDSRWLFLASAAAATAFLVRQNGLMLTVAMTAQLAVLGRLTWRRLLCLSLAPAGACAAYTYWYLFAQSQAHGVGLYFAQGAPSLWNLADRCCGDLGFLGFFIFPLVLGLALGEKDFRWLGNARAAAVTGVLACWHLRAGFLPYKSDGIIQGILNHHGLGTVMIPDFMLKACGFFRWRPFWALATGASLFSIFYLCARPAAREQEGGEALSLLALPLALPFAVTLAAPRVMDRYLLTLLPGALLGAAWACGSRRFSRTPALLASAAILAFSLSGTADYLNWNQAKWAVAAKGAQAGIAADRIYAGQEWAGMFFYERDMTAIGRRGGVGPVLTADWMRAQTYRAFVSFSPRAPEARFAEAGRVRYWTPLGPGWRHVYLYRALSGPDLRLPPQD